MAEDDRQENFSQPTQMLCDKHFILQKMMYYEEQALIYLHWKLIPFYQTPIYMTSEIRDFSLRA